MGSECCATASGCWCSDGRLAPTGPQHRERQAVRDVCVLGCLMSFVVESGSDGGRVLCIPRVHAVRDRPTAEITACGDRYAVTSRAPRARQPPTWRDSAESGCSALAPWRTWIIIDARWSLGRGDSLGAGDRRQADQTVEREAAPMPDFFRRIPLLLAAVLYSRLLSGSHTVLGETERQLYRPI